jgi:hypothetical protein
MANREGTMASAWQDAVGTLARERELAEGGARLLKAHAAGDAAAMARGEQLYSKAKAASDELVERLLMAVQEGDDPGRSTSLQQAATEAVERRLAFTRHVEERLPRAEGTRAAEVAGWLDLLDPVKSGPRRSRRWPRRRACYGRRGARGRS